MFEPPFVRSFVDSLSFVVVRCRSIDRSLFVRSSVRPFVRSFVRSFAAAAALSLCGLHRRRRRRRLSVCWLVSWTFTVTAATEAFKSVIVSWGKTMIDLGKADQSVRPQRGVGEVFCLCTSVLVQ